MAQQRIRRSLKGLQGQPDAWRIHRERMERVRFSECDLKTSSSFKTLSAQLTDSNHGTNHPLESKRSLFALCDRHGRPGFIFRFVWSIYG